MARNRQQLNWSDLAMLGCLIMIGYAICRSIVQLIVYLVREIYFLGKWIYLSTKQCFAAKKAKDLERELTQQKLPPHDEQTK